ncbi:MULTISPECIES: DUF1361 domain-containing protein [Paenibacillus]|uniref:DUF1361 domain-containing protein n=1 Tax=Paenibacillus TaxID=44249 RepID=UPI0022B8B55D|nr:DUF1361 domain-containing protein [Paenibacillus caseinilyticus]MCZ8520661.1 DUF1361 domain-containing protein [Paenibacillus caseinilyticus]
MQPLPYRPVLGLLGGLTVLSLVVHVLVTNVTYYNFLIWNLFLAWLPFLFSSAAGAVNRRHRQGSAVLAVGVLGIAWLLLLPNAFYILTDLIHVTVRKDLYTEAGRLGFGYWTDFLLIFIFAWNGILLGFVSLHQFQYIIYTRSNYVVSWLFAMLVSYLSGYGILLGREHRLNSWDVLQNMTAVQELLRETLTPASLHFVLLSGTAILMAYASLHVLARMGVRESGYGSYP